MPACVRVKSSSRTGMPAWRHSRITFCRVMPAIWYLGCGAQTCGGGAAGAEARAGAACLTCQRCDALQPGRPACSTTGAQQEAGRARSTLHATWAAAGAALVGPPRPCGPQRSWWSCRWPQSRADPASAPRLRRPCWPAENRTALPGQLCGAHAAAAAPFCATPSCPARAAARSEAVVPPASMSPCTPPQSMPPPGNGATPPHGGTPSIPPASATWMHAAIQFSLLCEFQPGSWTSGAPRRTWQVNSVMPRSCREVRCVHSVTCPTSQSCPACWRHRALPARAGTLPSDRQHQLWTTKHALESACNLQPCCHVSTSAGTRPRLICGAGAGSRRGVLPHLGAAVRRLVLWYDDYGGRADGGAGVLIWGGLQAARDLRRRCPAQAQGGMTSTRPVLGRLPQRSYRGAPAWRRTPGCAAQGHIGGPLPRPHHEPDVHVITHAVGINRVIHQLGHLLLGQPCRAGRKR